MKSRRGMENAYFLFIPLAIFIILVGVIYITAFNNPFSSSCGDKTPYNQCSLTKPYYCQNGALVEKTSKCSCPSGFDMNGESCKSDLTQTPKEITLNYFFNGEKKSMNFTVYEEAYDYFTGISRQISYLANETPSRTDFKLKFINEPKQKDLLLPLVVKIKNITPDLEDQARIAVSIVQNIPWAESNKTTKFGKERLPYSRYPYEVLYEMQGICGEKSELLAFLLKEIGFETVIFYNHAENHESVGVKCSSNDWKETGYCFVETAGPAIISDNSLIYSGGITLQSMPEVLHISDGESFGYLWEYHDAKTMSKIRDKIKNTGVLNFYYDWKYKKLKEKYGLDGEYQIG